ncbi:hypothetical protein [Lactobacillus reuteri TD1] [Lactiplantibacillus mudanjiangensis]|nr:hypothetical protein [Lactobacillus reuteri TD1] [Lactiplantibacillus mudanjiangensis]
MRQTFDWNAMVESLRSNITAISGLPTVPVNSIGKRQQWPFIAFNLPMTNSPDTFSRYPDNEVFETTVPITIYTATMAEGIQYCDDLQANLRTSENRTQLADAGIVIVNIMNPGSRSTPLQAEREFMYGFDLRLRLQRDFDSDTPTINDVDSPVVGNTTNIEEE